MTRIRMLSALAGVAILSGWCLDAQRGWAQSSAATAIEGITWTELQRLPLASDPTREESIGVAEIQPGTPALRHSHAENEIGYVLDGESILEVDGETTRTIRAGDSFAIPAGRVHRARPVGKRPLKVVVTYIVVKGQPLAEPAH